MEQLGGMDRAYVGLESEDMAADFVGIITLDPSTAPDRHDFARVHAETAAWAPTVPALTRRLVTAPLAAAPEQWVVDPAFDIDRHLHRVAAPAPGDLDALRRLTLDLCSRPLPRDRPLWQMWYVEDLDLGTEGTAAVLVQLHHAAIDGMGAVGLFASLFGTEPTPVDPDLAPAGVAGERVPSTPELLVRTAPEQLAAPLRAAGSALELAGARIGALGELLAGEASPNDGDGEPGGDGESSAPVTLLNRPTTSGDRSLALTTIGLDEVKDVARAAGGTVNDVMLALVAGALRTYLGGHGELPERRMRAMCPVNVRSEDDGGDGNAFTAMVVPLPTDLDDPAERLRTVVEITRARKPTGTGGGGAGRAMLELVDTLPSALFSLMGGLATGGALTMLPPVANLIVSNVRGSETTLYAAGARVTHIHGRTMAGPGLGMMIHCASYAGHLDVGVTALRELVGDPEVITEDIVAQLAQLR